MYRSVIRRFCSAAKSQQSKSTIPIVPAIGLIAAGTLIGANYQQIKRVFDEGISSVVTVSEDVKKDDMTEIVSTPPTATLPPLPYLSDQLFETTDNMLVFMFPSEEKFREQSGRVGKIIAEFQSAQNMNSSLQPVKVMYTIVPPSHPNVKVGDNVEIMCYKGQRKMRTSIPLDESSPIESWSEFFKFRSSPVDEELATCCIEHVSGDNFEDKVVTRSSVEKPILVQLYEKSCFLCFLMRPFLNQIATILSKCESVPITFKRLDIEENDFPEKLPVVRGTPTFVLFQGPDRPPVRFEEFKPRDLVRRLCLDYTIPPDVETSMYELVDKVATRFQMFSGIIMWNTESEKILDMLSGSQKHHLPTIAFDLKSAEEKDKEMFNKFVAELMAEDMLKVDLLEENVEDLKRELTRAEMHAITMGQVLGEKIVGSEANVAV